LRDFDSPDSDGFLNQPPKPKPPDFLPASSFFGRKVFLPAAMKFKRLLLVESIGARGFEFLFDGSRLSSLLVLRSSLLSAPLLSEESLLEDGAAEEMRRSLFTA
jgi:hypothetical protein